MTRPLRVARTLAIAHEIVRLIADRALADQADAARTLGFTRARITQLVDLTMLAPDIQEQLLFTTTTAGRDAIAERTLRPLTVTLSWRTQRAAWSRLVSAERSRRRPP